MLASSFSVIVILAHVFLEASASCRDLPVENATGTHTVCTPSDGVPPLRKLVVYFCGSNGQPPAVTQPFLQHTTSLGFHFFGVNYNDSPTVGGFCKGIATTDPDCYEKLRLARLFGGDYQGTHIQKADGGVSRLQRVLPSLKRSEGWADFVAEDGTPVWDKIIVAGESQGAGMALMMAQHYAVSRVLQFGGVDDVVAGEGAAAPWIARKGWLTPTSRIYGLGNSNGFCCAYWHTNWPAAGMLGSFTNVDGGSAPYGGARMLCSSRKTAPIYPHVAPVEDSAYAPVWTYMLTGTNVFDEAAAAMAGGCDCPSSIAV